MRSWKTTPDERRKPPAMYDPRYARGPGPGHDYRAPQLPPARAEQRRRRAEQARAALAQKGFTPEPACAREGCGHKRGGHRKRLDGQWGRCNQCGGCEWYQAPEPGMAHPVPPGTSTATPAHSSAN